ncbi:MAG: hypothetical protein IJY91_01430 [Oscillospiraceae bacterium]|nr:hypothetical protein [Oscillospiraceae bacterium]
MRKHRKFIAALLVLLMIGTVFITDVRAETEWTPSGLEGSYDLGTHLVIPTRDITVGGTKVTARTTVLLPDGTVTTNSSLQLEQVGKYTVTYTVSVNDKIYIEEESFFVLQDLVTLTSEASAAQYERYPHINGVSGLNVQLEYGDKLTINQPIDMSKLEDGLLIQAFAVPSNVGNFDYEKLCFQLTDAENPNITLYMSARQYTNRPDIKVSYITAGGNGQEIIGYDDFADKFWNEGLFGRSIDHGFAFQCTNIDHNAINLRLDSETMQILANDKFVVDLDSVEYQKSPWSGFPSGKAYLTVWAENYRGTTAGFFLSKVGDVNLSREKIRDTEAPEITVDTPYETMPPAVVGGSYSVPAAQARDSVSGVCQVTVSAWYNYSSADASILNIVDGRIETKYWGDYAIVYEATDSSGNLGRKILWIKAENQLTKPSVTLKEAPKTDYVLGEAFQSTPYETQCHSGEPAVEIYTEVDGKQVALNDKYYFEKTGSYTIVYEVMDCAGQIGTYSHTAEVTVGDKPIMVDGVNLPRFLIEESEYTFPQVYFNDYRSGQMEKKLATGKLVDAAGTTDLKAGDTYRILVDKHLDTAKLIFECDGATYEVERPVVKAYDQDEGKTRLFLENYFVGEGFTTLREENNITFIASAADAKWTFANALLATDFSMVLGGVPGKSDFAGLKLVFADSTDSTQKLEVELLNLNGVLSVKVGDKQIRMGEVSIAAGHEIPITYQNNTLHIAGFEIDTGDFEGFQSNFLMLSLFFREAADGAAISLLSLNNHAMNNSNRDRVEAWIDIAGTYGGRHEQGSEIRLPAAFAGDVLNPNVRFTVTVKQGNQIVTALDGTVLDHADPTKEYTIMAQVADRYTVQYTTEESFSEKEGGITYILHIVDASAPELQFQQALPTQAKVGDTVCIPQFTLSDNKTGVEDLIVMKSVVCPSGVIVTVPADSNAIKVSQEGIYKFMIMVVDADGYVHNETWSVTVTENQQ